MLEKNFEKQIESVARLMGCIYFKIPDTKMITKDNRRFHHEQKRPFDGVLITPNRTFIIEAKIKYGALKPHQRVNLEATNKINGQTGYVVRWFDKKIRIEMIGENGSLVRDAKGIKELIQYFINIG